MGVVRGTEIEAAFASASGDPVAYRVRGALVALRREQAEWVRVEPLQADAAWFESEQAHSSGVA